MSTHPAKKSVAIAAAHAGEMSADLMREAINGHQRQSMVIRAGEMSADLMRAAINGHPRASVVIRGRRTWGGSDEGW